MARMVLRVREDLQARSAQPALSARGAKRAQRVCKGPQAQTEKMASKAHQAPPDLLVLRVLPVQVARAARTAHAVLWVPQVLKDQKERSGVTARGASQEQREMLARRAPLAPPVRQGHAAPSVQAQR